MNNEEMIRFISDMKSAQKTAEMLFCAEQYFSFHIPFFLPTVSVSASLAVV